LDTRQWALSSSEEKMLRNEVWRISSRKPFLATAAVDTNKPLALRFDEACMAPVTSGARLALDVVRTAIRRSISVDILWRADDLLVIDNRRLLHARGTSASPDPDRTLARILIA
jgi:hypothetical protein